MGVPGIYNFLPYGLIRVTLGVLDMKKFENHCTKGWADVNNAQIGLLHRLMNTFTFHISHNNRTVFNNITAIVFTQHCYSFCPNYWISIFVHYMYDSDLLYYKAHRRSGSQTILFSRTPYGSIWFHTLAELQTCNVPFWTIYSTRNINGPSTHTV